MKTRKVIQLERVAQFEKVSYEQFKKDMRDIWYQDNLWSYDEKTIKEIYDNIKLPKRSTKHSAGYDFFVPAQLTLAHNSWTVIPTGIKCRMNEGWVLQIYPRSGHGFKYGIHLTNTVGIIDKDYYNNINNEGHIMVKLINDSIMTYESLKLNGGDAFCQGILLPFGITEDDESDATRTGGFGSTDNTK